ncbi:hypothetical protein BN2364_1724 [Alloalcanivorax xenomutans]|nr:hypothetical protein BN2364_1724 [Alloalcanivorax xenomutans]
MGAIAFIHHGSSRHSSLLFRYAKNNRSPAWPSFRRESNMTRA